MASWWHYVVPFGIFILLTEIGNLFPELTYWFYTLKTILVGLLLFFWRRFYAELWMKSHPRDIAIGILAGLGVLLFWVGMEGYLPQLSESKGISPYLTEGRKSIIFLNIFFRLLGTALVVPVMEELFWRSFLMRYFINKKFYEVPLGTYTHFSFWAVAVLFALEHFRIIPGLLAGVTYGWLICWSKNLRVSIVSHLVTNLGLGIYVLFTHQWKFW